MLLILYSTNTIWFSYMFPLSHTIYAWLVIETGRGDKISSLLTVICVFTSVDIVFPVANVMFICMNCFSNYREKS